MWMTPSWSCKGVKDIASHSKRNTLAFHSFHGFEGNYQKSCLFPINVNSDVAISLANAFGCMLGSFPFTYLRLPLGLTKLQVKDYAPLIYRIERRFLASADSLSYLGQLKLVNSIISSLPTYYMCTLKLLVAIIKVIYKYRKNYL